LKLATAIFAAVLALLFVFEGTRIVFTNDEGIILEAAQRMARGERLYVDFFGYMSPGGYWLQALAFKALGISLPAARAVVFTDFALQCAVIAWLCQRFASRRAAIVTVLIFIGLHVPQPGLLTAQHRWDSAALAILSAALFIGNRWIGAGAAAAMAAICTPSVATVALVTGAWLAYRREWPALLRYAAGGLGAGIAALILLAITGSLPGFLAQMQWLRDHYSAVNVMPYGSIIGGWGALFTGHGPELVIGALLVLGLAIPAILPVIVVPWSAWLGRRQPHYGYLGLVIVALVVSTFPRADVMHLAFFAALPLALGAILITPHRFAGPAGAGLGVVALLYTAGYATTRFKEQPIASPLGQLRAPDASLNGLLTQVRPGTGLFVHPYLPLFYFLTQARNPTRYSYLAPGMMAFAEEQQTLADLEQRPPEWVLYLPLTREEFLRVFPNATGLDNRFNAIEHWISEHYAPTGTTVSGYELRRRRETGEITRRLDSSP
jgi:hypothetical protein